MNNAVYSGRELIGFRCFTCGDIFQSMWDCTCNGCRAAKKANETNEKILAELKLLRETIADKLLKQKSDF